jgi:tRNA nucleotidyltransferase (CCA-adding enzyme)
MVEPKLMEEKNVLGIAEEVKQRVEDASKRNLTVHSVEIGGSVAKGTWLTDNVDVDIFVKFDSTISKKRLEDLGVKIGRDALLPNESFLRYSEHPYVVGIIDGIIFNIVPCYDVVKGSWKSSADRSPYHTSFMKNRFNKILKNETRLLKKFLKVLGLYGAEIKVKGFSGYVCEVLILKYGSFISVLKAMSNLIGGEILSLDDIDEDITKKFDTQLVILDPVDNRRNLGAAISPVNVSSFIMASRSFLEKPSIMFFKGISVSEITDKVKKSTLLDRISIVILRHEPRTVDILWGQLHRSVDSLSKQISKVGFNVLRTSVASDEDSTSAFIFLLDSLVLPKSQIKMGPNVNMKGEVSKFLNSNRKWSKLMWVGHDQRIYIMGDRRFLEFEKLLYSLLDDTAKGSGVAPGLKRALESGIEVISGKNIVKATSRRQWLIEALYRVVITDEFSFG